MVINVFMNSFNFCQLNVAKTFMTEESWILQMSTSAPLKLGSPLTSQTAPRSETQLVRKSESQKVKYLLILHFIFH